MDFHSIDDQKSQTLI